MGTLRGGVKGLRYGATASAKMYMYKRILLYCKQHQAMCVFLVLIYIQSSKYIQRSNLYTK